MYLEYFNKYKHKESSIYRSEDTHGKEYNPKVILYNTISVFIKDNFSKLFQDESYEMCIRSVADNSPISININDIYKSTSKKKINKFEVTITTHSNCDNPIYMSIDLWGTIITSFDIDDFSMELIEKVYDAVDKKNNSGVSVSEGIVTISSNSQSVEGTTLEVGQQKNEFMRNMNTKFVRKGK